MRSPTPADQLYIHFVTFSCYKRRRIFEFDDANRIALGSLNARLKEFSAICSGFVLMPDHVHCMLWFPVPGQLSRFLREWKRTSSFAIKERMRTRGWNYRSFIATDDPIWQANFYSSSHGFSSAL